MQPGKLVSATHRLASSGPAADASESQYREGRHCGPENDRHEAEPEQQIGHPTF